jgi:dTDP-glucose 4,6-dehydratase
MKTAVVTGAAGFLGSHLTDRLLAEGYRVVGIDNYLTGSAINLEHLASDPRFDFQEQDITTPFTVAGDVDVVYNMASPASPIDYLELPLETMKVGSHGTQHSLELAQTKEARFLMASTSECYGDPQVHPQREDYWGHVNPIGPRSVYDEAKRFSEAMTMAFHRTYGVDTKIVRIFNTYGPRMRLNDGRVVPAFISQALRSEPLTIFGDGRQTRSFCYCGDLIDGIFKLSLSTYHEPVNIGNPVELSMNEFAERILRLTGATSQIVYKPLPQDDPKQRRPDITKARELLGWEPQVDLETGLSTTIDYFKTKV